MKTKMMIGLMMIMLSACGGSGGSSSPSTGDGGLPPGGGNGGGNPPTGPIFYYKGISTEAYRVEEEVVPAVSDVIDLGSAGYIHYANATTKSIEFMVKNSNCLLGGAYEDYALTLINGGTLNQISIRRTSSSITWTEHKMDTVRTDTYSANISISCNDGYSVGSGNEFYANGSIITLMTSNGDVYFGIRDNLLVNSGSYAGDYNRYIYNQAGYDNSAGGVTISNVGGVSDVTNFLLFNGNVNTVYSTNALAYHNNGNGSTTHHISLQNANGWMTGIFGTLNGKKLMAVSLPQNKINDCDSSGCYGVGQLIIAVEK